jgi:hypothetical protein
MLHKCVYYTIFTFTPCMLLHLLYSKPTHAFLLNTLSHPHFKALKLFKKICKNIIKPYMFRSLMYDHPQRSSFVLSALKLLRLFASSSCLFGMWLYVVYVCVCVCVCVCLMYLSVGCLVVNDQTSHRQVHQAHTHTHIDNIQPHTK